MTKQKTLTLVKTAPEENLNVLRFMQILIDVSKRVETSKPVLRDVKCSGLIDKLEFDIQISLEEDQWNHNIKGLGFIRSTTKLNNNQWYEKVSDPDDGWSFHFKKHYTLKTITQIVTNPSDFKSLNSYILNLKSLIFPLTLADIRISRLDLTCDYEIPFDSFIQCLDIKSKRNKTTHTAADVTGIYFGQRPNVVLAYDKSKQLGQPTKPLSRIELSLTGKALPFKDARILDNAEMTMAKLNNYGPFKDVALSEIEICGDSSLAQEFKIHLKAHGFHAARLQMNKNKNFNRDIEPHLIRKPFTKQPSEALMEGLQHFCYGGEREQSNNLRPRIF